MSKTQQPKTLRKKRKTSRKDDIQDLDESSPFKRTLGVFCAMSSCIFFAVSSLLVKLLQEIPPQEVVFFRSLVQVIFVLPPLIYGEIPIVGDQKHLPFLCVRGVAGTLALCCQFYAFQHMPLADATVIVFSSPIFTGVLAHFLLGESWGLFDALATLLCFTGVVLIARPTFLFSRPMESANLTSDWEQVTDKLNKFFLYCRDHTHIRGKRSDYSRMESNVLITFRLLVRNLCHWSTESSWAIELGSPLYEYSCSEYPTYQYSDSVAVRRPLETSISLTLSTPTRFSDTCKKENILVFQTEFLWIL